MLFFALCDRYPVMKYYLVQAVMVHFRINWLRQKGKGPKTKRPGTGAVLNR